MPVLAIRQTIFPALLILFTGVVKSAAQSLSTIEYTSSSLSIDGLSDDWDNVATLVFNVTNPRTLDSNAVKARFSWDEQFLYGLVEVSDRQLIKIRSGTNNPTLNLGDAIEVFIDPLHDSNNRMDLNDYQFILDIGHDAAVFKGDKTFILEEYRAPKDTGIATIAYDFTCFLEGSLNVENDTDSGYLMEFALPWAALGVHAMEGLRFRLDLCVDDMDALVKLEDYTEADTIIPYTFGNALGDTSFGFPDRWPTYQLTGRPDLLTRAWRYFGKTGFLLLVFAGFGIGLLAFRQFLVLRRLRDLPRQSELKHTPAVNWAVENIHHPDLPNMALYDQLRRLILEKIDEDLRPEDLASAAAISLRQLQRIFKEELETSPHQFITMIKMEKAAELLRSGNHHVAEVAYATGFNDPAYFSKVFKKYFGVSPKQIQTQIQIQKQIQKQN